MSNGDRKSGVPMTVASIPLVDPHAPKPDPSVGDLVKDATSQMSTLVRAEVELARAEITRDVKKGLTGSVYFILALVVLFYSTFFFFFFVADLLDMWLQNVGGDPHRLRRDAADDRTAGVPRLPEGQEDQGPAEDDRVGQGGAGRAGARRRQAGKACVTQRRRVDRRSIRLVMARARRSGQPPPDPSVTRIAGPWRHMDVHANGIRFHVVEANPVEANAVDSTSAADQPLVILLHGFGSFWWSWRHQLRGLQGARVVAVDLRGYGGSDKPPRGYDGWTLAGDTAGLIRALGHETATLVGHADGGLVCWATAVLHPRVVRSIAVVSSPHPVALRASALTRRDQGLALLPWMMRYQAPFWPERSLTRDDAAELEAVVRSQGRGQMACLR